tara:strand:+ start:508 stop:753 length:246 start_codon:yes stop_codon:yes gene_type:complete
MARVSIEDCLDYMENRFALVSVASHRTRQLMSGKTPLVKTKNKEAVTALREIAEGLVVTANRKPAVSGANSFAEENSSAES